MVDDKSEQTGAASDPGSVDINRRTRTPPTIDLEASRVESARIEAAESAHDHTAHAAASSEIDPVSDADASASASETAPSDSYPSGASRAASEPDHKRSGVVVPALVGAIAALLIGCGAWFAGLIGGSNTQQQASMVATIETLAARVARLEAVPTPPSSLKPDAALTARLDAMDKSLAMLREGLASHRAQLDRLTKAIDEIKAAPRDSSAAAVAAAAPDLSAVESRIAQLDAKTQALSADSAQVKESVIAAQAKADKAAEKAAEVKPAPPADDTRLRRIIAANSLDLAVRQGEPFAAALGTAKQLSDNAAVLKPLEAFAATGVPGAAVLSRELLALLPQLEPKTEGQSTAGGWFDRLQANATKLIKFRRNGAVAGDDTAAILSRVAAAAQRGDVTEAKRELSALPQADRAKAQPWIDRVDARDAALAASRQFAANAMAALTTSPR